MPNHEERESQPGRSSRRIEESRGQQVEGFEADGKFPAKVRFEEQIYERGFETPRENMFYTRLKKESHPQQRDILEIDNTGKIFERLVVDDQETIEKRIKGE